MTTDGPDGPDVVIDRTLSDWLARLRPLSPDPLLLAGRTNGELHLAIPRGLSTLEALTLVLRLAERLERERQAELAAQAEADCPGRRLIDWIIRQEAPQAVFRRATRLGRDAGYPASIVRWDEAQCAEVLHALQKPGRDSSRWGGNPPGGSRSIG